MLDIFDVLISVEKILRNGMSQIGFVQALAFRRIKFRFFKDLL